MFTYKQQIGKGYVEFEAQNLKQVIKGASFLSDIPGKCDLCGSEDVTFSYYKTKDGYDYYGVKCSCGAKLNFGQKRDDGSFFVKHDAKFEKYQAQNNQQKSQNYGDEPF